MLRRNQLEGAVMDHLDKTTNEEPRQMESELMDLGEVSVETKGGFQGHVGDPGWGLRWP
jgi:hypothetical protein